MDDGGVDGYFSVNVVIDLHTLILHPAGYNSGNSTKYRGVTWRLFHVSNECISEWRS